jgi:hypothetical protein
MTPADTTSEARRPRPAPAAPCPSNETVAFDDLFMERWSRSPCVLCHVSPPGHSVLWLELETGYVVMFPICQPCQRRPNMHGELAYAMQRRLHPEAPRWTPSAGTPDRGETVCRPACLAEAGHAQRTAAP